MHKILFSRAVFCLLGCVLSDTYPEVVDKTDDYLWLKLCQLHPEAVEESGNIPQDRLTFQKLQTQMLEEFGKVFMWHCSFNYNSVLNNLLKIERNGVWRVLVIKKISTFYIPSVFILMFSCYILSNAWTHVLFLFSIHF